MVTQASTAEISLRNRSTTPDSSMNISENRDALEGEDAEEMHYNPESGIKFHFHFYDN